MAMERRGEEIIYCRRGDVIDLNTWKLETDKKCEEKEVKEKDEATSSNT